MKLLVERREQIEDDWIRLSFRHSVRPHLPAWTPGAHVDLRLEDGIIRQYSLTSDPDDLSLYSIIVKREKKGRGGSKWVHDNLTIGREVRVTKPRNQFQISTERSLLIAGGIGVTPLMSMARSLSESNLLDSFHFCTQKPVPTVEKDLKRWCGSALHTYISNDPTSEKLNLPALIRSISQDMHIVCCGPDRLMSQVRDLTGGWDPKKLHFEVFNNSATEDHEAQPFEVTVLSTGETLLVPADKSILDVLNKAGYVVPSSCRQGICGTCECEFSSGEVIHLDSLLQPADRKDRLLPCVSRAKGSVTIDV